MGSVAGGWDRPYPREVGEVGIVRAGVDRLDELVELVADNELARRFYEREGFTATFVQMHRRLTPTEAPDAVGEAERG